MAGYEPTNADLADWTSQLVDWTSQLVDFETNTQTHADRRESTFPECPIAPFGRYSW